MPFSLSLGLRAEGLVITPALMTDSQLMLHNYSLGDYTPGFTRLRPSDLIFWAISPADMSSGTMTVVPLCSVCTARYCDRTAPSRSTCSHGASSTRSAATQTTREWRYRGKKHRNFGLSTGGQFIMPITALCSCCPEYRTFMLTTCLHMSVSTNKL